MTPAPDATPAAEPTPERSEPSAVEEAAVQPELVATPAPELVSDSFENCWKTLFSELFSANHLVYHSLKDETPRYENDTIFIEVKNNIQKEQIESRKVSILEYWRNHFALNVDELEVTVNEQKEEKKVIVNAEDKMRNMAEQNDQLLDFLNVLNFRMKE